MKKRNTLFSFKKANKQKFGDDIIDQISSAIKSGQIPPYYHLPKMEELVSIFNVHSDTVKSALNKIKAKGYRIKTG